MATHVISLAYSVGGVAFSKTVQVEAESGQQVDIDLQAAGETNKAFTEPTIDASNLKAIAVFSPVDCTLKTNDSGSPDDTITIEANKPMIWYEGCGLANPITVDVTDWFVTSDPIVGGAELTIFVIQDISA